MNQRQVIRLAWMVITGVLLGVLVSGSTTVAQNPTETCDAEGLAYVDRIDGIEGSGTYTSDEGFSYTVTVTDNPNPDPDDYTLDPTPAASGFYPGFTNITEVPKFGQGGGLSHITICGETGGAPTATATTAPDDEPTATTVPVTSVPDTGVHPGGTGGAGIGTGGVVLSALAAVLLLGAAALVVWRSRSQTF
jgi:hypothetical protein